MQTITILTGEENEKEIKNWKDVTEYNESIVFQFKEFVNNYLKKQFPDLGKKKVIINGIPNWELVRIYRIILNTGHEDFTLIVHYKAEDVINKYA